MMRFAFLGGTLCLDFSNTVAWRGGDPEERLSSYDDLLEWAAQAGLLTRQQQTRLRNAAIRPKGDGNAVLARARRFREALYRVFSAVVNERAVAAQDLTVINEEADLAVARMRLVAREGRFEWEWIQDDDALDGMLWRVAKSATDLLTTGDLSRIRQCEGPGGCGWLFLDTTRNRSRRWCDMRDCGNRVKVGRYYRKHRGSRSGKSAAAS
jgi:predicted RNA-binding Zn ribbon-like protein